MTTLESLGNKLFEYTIIHGDTIDILALKIGITVNDLLRIQSKNKFVNPKSILLVQKFFDEKDEL
ncbi:LysM peptidoglycan-binding domain-containing protein [Leuconostoc mesenteroides]|uniref:LysM peptidoglycan-binding domain-containing protein n=1 Tax=Leuconostoc mesenteroides TaxID=1245 RepID=UPI00235DDE01|nr:LysM domain-containing protein [Leuconostoc mesenteroides]